LELSDGAESLLSAQLDHGLGKVFPVRPEEAPFLLLESQEMSEQELRARLKEILVSLCDPSLDDESRRLMLTVAKELQELIQASWPHKKAN